MLDKETKDRINTARDILVGKVPDPKSQVEQITIALIYKFMDDMDLEAEELGGARSFFTGEYEKYAWHKLFAPSTGGEQRLLLYSEALLKLSQNPGLPSLFRDIFKNAYLPYRDPETLSSFLKEINKFSYDHSERLGDAFEFLLSVLGSQGDAGQFRTPRHLIDFMVAVADPRKDETILDPACGTAGFLISSYKHILRHNTARGKSTLTPDERRRLAENFRGYDISPDMVRLSLVNLYLHGFAEPRIHEYDTLTSEDRWNEYYDIVLANPPFMSPKGGIRPHKRFRIASNRSEVLFVDYIAEHLSTQGRAAVIVPEGIIFQSGTAYKELRKMLVDGGFLVGVISLPAGVFNPYSGVKTSILWLDKSLAKKTGKLLFVKIENDGYDLGAQRRELKSSDLPEALRAIEAYKQAVQTGAAFDAERWENVTVVEKARVAENGEYGLSGERYRERITSTSSYKMVCLHEVAQINPPKGELIALDEEMEVSFVPMADLSENQISFSPTEKKLLKEVIKGYTYFKENDVLVAKITPCFENGKAGLARNLVNGIGFGSTEFYVIRAKDVIKPELIYYYLTTSRFQEMGRANMTGSAGQQRVPRSILENFQIPLPPLTVQQELVAEIEGYQRVIEGARQVVESYRPRVEVEEGWEWVELGEVATQYSGGTPSKQNPEFWEGSIPWVSPKDMKVDFLTDTEDHISEDAIRSSATKLAEANTILVVVRSGILQHSLPVAITTKRMCFNQDIIAIKSDEKKLDVLFLFYYLKTHAQVILKEGIKPGVTVQSFHSGYFKKLQIPLPDLATQRRIVSELEREREWVEGCRALVRWYEERVRRRVARVWGV
jgi:type I restriction enzyme M protein